MNFYRYEGDVVEVLGVDTANGLALIEYCSGKKIWVSIGKVKKI